MRAKHSGELLHNGLTNYMPSARHNGRSLYSISDAISVFNLKHPVSENFPSGENSLVNATVYDSDMFRKPNYHDGKNNHNSVIFHSGRAMDFLSLIQRLFLQDTVTGSTYHNGVLRYNKVENHNGLGNIFAYEKELFKIGVTANEEMPVIEDQVLNFENDTSELVSRYLHNRKYKHNGAIFYDGPIYEAVDMRIELSPEEDYAGSILRHNKSIKHSGTEKHSFTGTQSVYESLAAELENNYLETAEMSEVQALAYDYVQNDVFTHDYRHNRSIKHDGTAYRCSIINDKNVMDFSLSPMADTQRGRLLHNCSAKRDGEEQHQSQRIAYDTFTAGIRYHHFYNGVYFRNNGIKHNAGVLLPLEDIA
jgi:hypothetical protein